MQDVIVTFGILKNGAGLMLPASWVYFPNFLKILINPGISLEKFQMKFQK